MVKKIPRWLRNSATVLAATTLIGTSTLGLGGCGKEIPTPTPTPIPKEIYVGPTYQEFLKEKIELNEFLIQANPDLINPSQNYYDNGGFSGKGLNLLEKSIDVILGDYSKELYSDAEYREYLREKIELSESLIQTNPDFVKLHKNYYENGHYSGKGLRMLNETINKILGVFYCGNSTKYCVSWKNGN
jgi:hypothetical protein